MSRATLGMLIFFGSIILLVFPAFLMISGSSWGNGMAGIGFLIAFSGLLLALSPRMSFSSFNPFSKKGSNLMPKGFLWAIIFGMIGFTGFFLPSIIPFFISVSAIFLFALTIFLQIVVSFVRTLIKPGKGQAVKNVGTGSPLKKEGHFQTSPSGGEDQESESSPSSDAVPPQMSKESFERMYESCLKGKVEELKALPVGAHGSEGKKKINKPAVIFLFLLFAGSVLFLVYLGAGSSAIQNVFFLLFIFLFGWVLYNGVKQLKQVKRYEERYTEDLLPHIASLFKEDLDYNSTSDFSAAELDAALLLPIGIGNINSIGTFYGRLNNMDFKFTEGSLDPDKKILGSSKNPEGILPQDGPFHGFVFQARSMKRVQGTTVIRPKVFQWFAHYYGKKDTTDLIYEPEHNLKEASSGKELEEVNLEDPVFDSIYKVYGTDQVEARYLLTVDLMERLKGLYATGSEKVFISFHGSNVFLLVPFKPVLNLDRKKVMEQMKKGLDKESLYLAYVEFHRIFWVLEDLQLEREH